MFLKLPLLIVDASWEYHLPSFFDNPEFLVDQAICTISKFVALSYYETNEKILLRLTSLGLAIDANIYNIKSKKNQLTSKNYF